MTESVENLAMFKKKMARDLRDLKEEILSKKHKTLRDIGEQLEKRVKLLLSDFVEATYFNEKRHATWNYGPPWIAKVTSMPVQGAEHSSYMQYGKDEDKSETHAMILAKPGELVAYGRNIVRKKHQHHKTAQQFSFTRFAVVEVDGSLRTLPHKEPGHFYAAIAYWRDHHAGAA